VQTIMFNEDDDGVEPQFDCIIEYYFEDDQHKPVCFSILHLLFSENIEMEEIITPRKVYLRGFADNKNIQEYSSLEDTTRCRPTQHLCAF
jgi:hypothetical protein